MIGDQKEVRFDKYCHKCEYEKVSESDPEGPCWDCLEAPTRQDSQKPINFKAKETKDEKPNRTNQE